MKNLVRFVGILAASILAAAQAQAVVNVLTSDNFTYADGTLSTGSGGIWSVYSGTTALNVLGGQADVTGARSQDDMISVPGGPHTGDILYYSFDLTVVSQPVGQGGYFAFFKDSSTFNFEGRLYATNDNGNVRIGLANTANASVSNGVAFWGTTLALNTQHKIVVELDQSGATLSSTLYIDPVALDNLGTGVTATDVPGLAHYDISGFGLRQSNAQQGETLIDNLVIYTIPEPSTIVLLGAGLAGLLALRRRS